MDELARIFVLGVEWFALWLERSPLHVAWPVLFVLVFQVFLFVVHVLQWFSRGLFLRVACDYPITTTKESDPCKNKTLGEWHRCHNTVIVGSGSLMAMLSIRICLAGRPLSTAFGWSAVTATGRELSAPDRAPSACSITAATLADRRR
jgi:hypothetical protein